MYAHIFKSSSAAAKKAWLKRNRRAKPQANTTGSGSMMESIVNSGGFTYSPSHRNSPKEGYSVSPYPKQSFAKPLKDLTVDDIAEYTIKNAALLNKKGHHIGGWHDTDTGMVFLDISVVVKTPKEAKSLSEKHDQIAYFDLKKGETVYVNKNATSGGVVNKGDSVNTKVKSTQVPGADALTLEGQKAIYKSITGKDMSPAEEQRVQAILDKHTKENPPNAESD